MQIKTDQLYRLKASENYEVGTRHACIGERGCLCHQRRGLLLLPESDMRKQESGQLPPAWIPEERSSRWLRTMREGEKDNWQQKKLDIGRPLGTSNESGEGDRFYDLGGGGER